VEGDWPLDALEKSKPGTERVFAGLTVGPSGQSTVLPTELPAILHAAGDSSLANFSTSAQRAALAWLAGPASAGLQGVAFAPIVGDNGNAGVVLFANAPAVRKQVMTYLASGGTPPSDLQAVVIDATLLRLLQVGTRIAGVQVKTPPQRFPSLEEWAKGGFIVIQDRELQSRGNDTRIPVPAHGQPHFGLAGATGNEDLLYGYGPVPPFAAGGALQAQFSRCTGVRFGTTVLPHSPVRLLATGPGGKTAGIDARGHAVATIPGAIVDHRGSKLAALHLPPGNFNLTVTGTGAGRATIVVSAPTHRSAQTRVFGFAVRRGERGTIPLTSGAAGGTMRWGGATLHAASGVGLTAHGLPAKLVHGRLAHLKITVTDQFGKRAPGISLAVSGSPVAHGLTAHSGASGVITLPIAPSRAGTLRVRLAGPGFATVTRALRVR